MIYRLPEYYIGDYSKITDNPQVYAKAWAELTEDFKKIFGDVGSFSFDPTITAYTEDGERISVSVRTLFRLRELLKNKV